MQLYALYSVAGEDDYFYGVFASQADAEAAREHLLESVPSADRHLFRRDYEVRPVVVGELVS